MLNLLPDLMDPSTTQSFALSMNDQMLVVYLSSLLWAVIVLHALVDNKTTIGKSELEKGEKEKTKKEKLETKDSEELNAESKDMYFLSASLHQ